MIKTDLQKQIGFFIVKTIQFYRNHLIIYNGRNKNILRRRGKPKND